MSFRSISFYNIWNRSMINTFFLVKNAKMRVIYIPIFNDDSFFYSSDKTLGCKPQRPAFRCLSIPYSSDKTNVISFFLNSNNTLSIPYSSDKTNWNKISVLWILYFIFLSHIVQIKPNRQASLPQPHSSSLSIPYSSDKTRDVQKKSAYI